MKVTIVNDENLVTIDGKSQTFDFSDIIDNGIWAVQWNGTEGEIEYRDPATENEKITTLTNFQDIIDRYSENETTVNTAEQIDLDNVKVTYKDGTSDTLTIEEANTNSITFTPIDLDNAKSIKKKEILDEQDAKLNTIFNTTDKSIQANARTMVGYKWGQLSFNQSRTTAENDALSIYSAVLDTVTTLDEERVQFQADVESKSTVQEVKDYTYTFSTLPPEILDATDATVKTFRQA